MVAGGTAAAQAITMAFAPFITRLYGPEAYGIQGVFMSVAGVLATVASLTYPIAIVLPKSDTDAVGLARLSVYIGIAMSFLAAVILFFYGPEILSLMNAEEISAFMYLLPVFMLISVVGMVMRQWLIRKKLFTLTAKVTVWQALVMNTAKSGLGLVQPTAVVLIVTNTLGALLAAAMMLLGLRKTSANNHCAERIAAPRPSIVALARRHRDFPMLRAPQELLNTVSQSIPVVVLAAHFGPASAGFYSIASAVLAVPAMLVGNSVMQAFYPRINEAIHQGEDVKGLIIKATLGLALIGAIPFAIVVVAGPALFGFVFGNEWQLAGVYAQWLSLWLFFQYVNKPAVSAIPALRLQKGLLIYEMFSTGTKVLALYLGYTVFKSDVAAIALFSVVGVAAYVWLIVWVIMHSGKLATRAPFTRS
jgi:O-antigen/teichoic acid export membrane protein